MPELDIRIFLGHLDDERRVIAKRGRENESGAVEIDHRFHRLGAGVGLRNILFLDDLDARHQFQGLGGDRMRLVPAEIVASPDIDDAHSEVARGQGAPSRAEVQGCPRDAPRSRLEERAARNFRC